VLPCNSKTKAPLLPHGHHDASCDPDTITEWWARWPDALIGAVIPPHLLVLDCDPRNGGSFGELRKVLGGLPPTLTCVSGRGDGGFHAYYLRPAGELTSARLPAGIDLKLCGYCIVAPSLHPVTGRAYRWINRPAVALPDRAVRGLRPIERPQIARRPIPAADLHRLPRWLCDRLEDADPPDRSAASHRLVAGCVHAGLDLGQTVTLMESWPPAVDKYGRRVCAEVERSWRKVGGVS
jgi:hypothetical protein